MHPLCSSESVTTRLLMTFETCAAFFQSLSNLSNIHHAAICIEDANQLAIPKENFKENKRLLSNVCPYEDHSFKFDL